MKRKTNAVGIDLGTTYSAIGVVFNGRVEIIPNQDGSRTTPSCVGFNGTERLVGGPAVTQAAVNPVNTVNSIKRLIGRRFGDECVQKDIENWPFTVVENEGGRPAVEVEYLGQKETYLPEQISSMILAKLKSAAEAYLGVPVTEAVITVPAYFKEGQRLATKDAGALAGLNVLRIISEPTAAAIAYGVDRVTKERTILVFDLGGGTFDVSIMRVAGSSYEVKAVSGDSHLGGDDFDNRLVDYFVEEFQRKHNRDLKTSRVAMRRLRDACERAKRLLSSTVQQRIEVDSLMNGIDFCSTVSRARFEDLCFDLFESTIPPVEKALADATLEKKDIDHIVLVGGSTRIPKIQEMLSEFFDGKRLNKNLNPDEAVAYGAAVQAALLSGDTSDATRDIILTDVTPLSLGIAVGREGSMDVVIPRNTIIPTSATRPYTTAFDNQTAVSFKVYEGERALAEDNNLLGQFTLTDIPPAPRRVPTFKVTFHLDADAILTVSAVDVGTGGQNQIRIENDKGRLSRDDINRMLQAAEDHRLQDEEHRLRLEAKNELESYSNAVQRTLTKNKVKDKLPDDEYSELVRLLRDANEVVNGPFSKTTLSVCRSNLKKLKEVWEPLVRNWYQDDQNAAHANDFADNAKHGDLHANDPRVDAMLNKLRWNDLFLKVTLALVFTLILMILLF